jgi:hypothetical protein
MIAKAYHTGPSEVYRFFKLNHRFSTVVNGRNTFQNTKTRGNNWSSMVVARSCINGGFMEYQARLLGLDLVGFQN